MKKVLLLVAAAAMSVSVSFAQVDDKEAAKAAKAAAKALKAEILAAKKDSDLSAADKDAKIKKAEEKIAALQKKCKEQSAAWLAEQAEDARKAKERFSGK